MNPSQSHQDGISVKGVENLEERYCVEKKSKFKFFNLNWRAKKSTISLGNDIIIQTDRQIRNVYINGKLYEPTPSTSQ